MRTDGRGPKPESRPHREVLRVVGRVLQLVPAIALLVAIAARGQQGSQKDSPAILQQQGTEIIRRFVEANRHWLLPSLEARRGLVYEYQQETPYLERVWFDGTGNILARLESSKENPGRPTRQSLWLADGRSYRGEVNDQFVKLPSLQNSNNPPHQPPSVQRDRLLQHLAMGVAIDCALTRLAREPDQFWAEVRPVRNSANRYLLVLHPKRDARLFTGTMLVFTSWAYMHDISYERSEILCDAATHRPVEEKDYAGSSDLKGHYIFGDWIDDFPGAAPGRIRAIVPHRKDGKNQSLEMTAQFRFARPGLWLLQEVESHFRGEASGSTGRVNVLAEATMDPVEIRQLLEKAKATGKILASIEEAPPGETVATLSNTNWCALFLKAMWTDQAWQSARDREREETEAPVLGVYRARICQGTNDSAFVELDGLSTSSWKEFLTSWTARLEDGRGAVIGKGSLDLKIRAENGPTPFSVRMQIPRSSGAFGSPPARVAVSGTVQRLTGAYHGHGIWYTFLDKK